MKRMAVELIRRKQKGAAIIEFALVAMLFFTLLLGIMEFGRALFVWNAIGEVTRMGARTAVVCDLNDADIKAKMIAFPSLASLTNANILINYIPGGCTTDCEYVEVSITGATFTPAVPLVNLNIPLPGSFTSLPRESMDSAGETNPVCQ